MKKQILLIDDCAMMRRFLVPVFKHEFEVVAKEGAVDGLAWLMENPTPAAVVLDYELPDMSGLEFLQNFRQRRAWSGVPVIMLSGIKDVEKRWQCLEAGADDFLSKPFHPKELALRVKKLLAESAPAILLHQQKAQEEPLYFN